MERRSDLSGEKVLALKNYLQSRIKFGNENSKNRDDYNEGYFEGIEQNSKQILKYIEELSHEY